MRQNQAISPDLAVTRAIGALGWLASDDELWHVFAGATGATAEDLATRAEDPAFLASVLDFILMDDAWVLDCAASLSLPPEALMATRACLPGGEAIHWT
ncbi:MAG: DUF3572 domain-containing protein [Shimia sp.]